MADGLVIIPTFNEIENIEAIVKTVFDLKKDFHVLVVDDNSPDGTADCVIKLQKEFPERLFWRSARKNQVWEPPIYMVLNGP